MTSPFNPGAPNINGMSPRDDIISGMLIINTLSMPFRGIDEAVRLACDTNVTRPACENVAGKVDALFKMVPEPVRNSVLQQAQNVELYVSSGLFRDYDIPFEDTRYTLESAKIIVEGVALMAAGNVVGKVAASAYKQAKHLGKDVINRSKALTQPTGLFEDIKPGTQGSRHIPLKGVGLDAVLILEYKFAHDRTLNLFVQYLTTIMEDGTWAEIGASTGTSGVVFQAFRKIVNTAQQLNAKEVLIQWVPANKRLFELASKTRWLKFIDKRPSITNSTNKLKIYSRETTSGNKMMPTFRLNLPPDMLSAGNLGKGFGVRWGASALTYAGAKIPGVDPNDAFWRELEKSLSSYDSREPRQILDNFSLQSNQKRITASVEDDEQEDQKPIVEVAKRTSLIAQIAELDSSQSIPGTSLFQKINEALPSQMEVTIENPTHLKKLNIRVMHPVGDDGFKAGLAFTPKNPKNTTVIVSKNVDDNTSVSLGFVPSNPKSSTITFSTTVEGVSGSLIVNPFKPKDSQISVSGKLDKVGVGYNFPVRKPLQGQVSVTTRVMISGIPALLAASISLRKPLESRVRLSVPLPGLTIPVVSISVQRVVKVYKSVERSIKKLFGNRKHKHREVVVVRVVEIDTSAAEASAHFMRGHAHYYQGNLAAAWEDFSKAYSLKPNDFWHAYYIGLTALSLHDRKMALEFVDKAEALNPGRCEDHDSLAGTYFKLDQFAKAAAHSSRAIQINSAQAQASKTILANSQKLQSLYQTLESHPSGSHDARIATASAILAIKSDHVNALFLRAHAHYYKQNMEQAWQDITKAYELKPNDFWIAYYVALTALELGERATALDFVDRASQLNPGRWSDNESLAGTYFKLDQFAKAAEHSSRAIQINSAQAQASRTILANSQKLQSLYQTLEAHPSGSHDARIVTASEILAIKSDHVNALFLRAHAYYYKQNLEQAWQDITKAYELKPNDFWIAYYVALTALELGERATALEFVDRASKLNPGRWSDNESLAGTYYKLDQFAKAAEHSSRAIQINSAQAQASRTILANSQKLQSLYQTLEAHPSGSHDARIVTASEILAIKSDHVNALFLRAHAYYYKQNLEQAWQDITKAYELKPNDFWIAYYVALTALELGERATALEFVDRASKLNPGRWSDNESLAGTYFKLDQFDKVIELSSKAIQLDSASAVKSKTYLADSQKLQPLVKKLMELQWGQFDEKIATANEILSIKSNHPTALFLRAHAYYCMGNPDLAWPDIKKAYEVDPHDYSITYYVGLTALKLNDPETAIAFIIKASEHPLKKHEPHETLASIYFKQNDLPRALQSVQRSLSINPQNGSSLELLERIRTCIV